MGYSIRMDRVKPSAIRSVQKRIASKQGVISFAAGLPDPDLFPMDDLKKSTMKGSKRRVNRLSSMVFPKVIRNCFRFWQKECREKKA